MFLNIFILNLYFTQYIFNYSCCPKCQNSTDHIFENKTSNSSSPTLSLIPSSLKVIIKPSYSDTATQYSPPPTTATENYSTNLVSPVPSLPALPTTNTTLHSMQDFNTKATQTDNHNNTLTSVSTQTDNHSRSGALEVNTGFSNIPELLESRSKTTATKPQELESEDPVLAIAHRVLDTIEFQRERIERAVHGTSQQLILGLLQRDLASLKNKIVMEENTLIWCSMVDKLREIEKEI